MNGIYQSERSESDHFFYPSNEYIKPVRILNESMEQVIMLATDHCDEKIILLKEWFILNKRDVKPAQLLLAVDYVKNYGYPVETACLLALESYLTNG